MAVGPAGHNYGSNYNCNCFDREIIVMIVVVVFSTFLGLYVRFCNPFSRSKPLNNSSPNITYIGTVSFSRKVMCEPTMSSWLDEMGNDCLLELLHYPFIIMEVSYRGLNMLLYRCKSLRKERSLAVGPIKIQFECEYGSEYDYVLIQIREVPAHGLKQQ